MEGCKTIVVLGGEIMANIQENLAEELFKGYYGSHFFMEREGEYSLYKSYQVSKEKELEWIKEIQNESLEKIKSTKEISDDFHPFCSSIEQYKSFDMLDKLIAIARDKIGKADTFNDVLLIRGITESIVFFVKRDINKYSMPPFIDETLKLWDRLLDVPVIVSERGIKSAQFNEEDDFEEYIKNRIKTNISLLKQMKESIR